MASEEVPQKTLTSLGYKIQQDEKRLADIEQKIAAEQVRYER